MATTITTTMMTRRKTKSAGLLEKHMKTFSIAGLLLLAAGLGMAQDMQSALQGMTSLTHPQSGSTSSSAPQASGIASARTQIAPGDFLSISVFDVPELAQDIRVDDKGNAVLTLLGSMHLGGMTTYGAQALIGDRLRQEEYVNGPRVTVTIHEFASFTSGGALQGTAGVSVLGEVGRPGVYPLLGTRSLLEIISDAGGTTPTAAAQVTVKRANGGAVLQATLSNNPGELLASNLELQLGDTVIVPKAGIVYILGDVGRPGGFSMADNGKVSLLQLVSLGGGPGRTANVNHAKFLHKTPDGLREEDINLKKILEGKQADIALKADDVVFVPSSTLKSMFTTPQTLLQSAAGAAIYTSIIH
jgi:polysaccharide export outer membrane protein